MHRVVPDFARLASGKSRQSRLLKNWLYPSLKLAWLSAMLRMNLLGAVIAGAYGVIHDQITYSISEDLIIALLDFRRHLRTRGNYNCARHLAAERLD